MTASNPGSFSAHPRKYLRIGRCTKVITYNGETLPSPIWAKRIGIAPIVLRARIRDGWTLEHALTTPKGQLRAGIAHKKRGRKPKSAQVPGCSAEHGGSR